ncbi:hypothetical protein JNUCC31_04245 [Paenibacillus sp. JNUCC31]|uniref:hypothetical protein n=1 Tax=Paenibacillus sp. JNUCC-31 TaxID=2777983 RepID=UPI00177BE08E|nr:hypothetical protein [Paenibacillus sp. JNUCC-31]QOS80158.1 hypothetical protein JNUCC31_04245 [Paenibacillus sp. JNUCC-31]
MFDLFNISDTADFEFIQSQIGTDVYINESVEPTRVVITNTNLEQIYDDKKISSLSHIHCGDIIVHEGNKYILITEISTERYNKYKGIMRRLPFTIIFNKNCVYNYVDAYIETATFGLDTGQYITLPSGAIYVTMKDSIDSQKIKLNDRFLIKGKAFKVTGIDTYERVGLCKITAQVDQLSSTDDLINNVADGLTCSVKIVSPSNNILLNVGESSQLVYKSLSGSAMLFSSSDSNVATINSNGIITTVGEGATTITVQLSNNVYYKDSIVVNVKLADKYTISATSDKSSLMYNESALITVKVYNNEVEVFEPSVTFSMVYANMTTPVPATIVELTNVTKHTANIHNVNAGIPEDCYIKVTLDSDSNIYDYIPMHLDYYRPTNKTIIVTGSTTITSNKTDTWTSSVSPNQEDVTWSLYADDQVSTTNKATISSQSGTSVVLKSAMVSSSVPQGYFQLKATLKTDSSVYKFYRIQLKSLI